MTDENRISDGAPRQTEQVSGERMTFGSGGFRGTYPAQSTAPNGGAPWQDPNAAAYYSQRLNAGYADPAFQAYYRAPDRPAEVPVSLGEWLWSILIMFVPVVGLAAAFIFAFGDSTKPSKKNFFRAVLIITLIIIVLYFVGIVAGLLLMIHNDPVELTGEIGRV